MPFNAFRFGPITRTSLRAAVRQVVQRGTDGRREAVFQAAAGSSELTRAIAAEYPFTFCPKAGCLSPILHEGSCDLSAVSEQAS